MSNVRKRLLSEDVEEYRHPEQCCVLTYASISCIEGRQVLNRDH